VALHTFDDQSSHTPWPVLFLPQHRWFGQQDASAHDSPFGEHSGKR
jgi:hypothetical protein